MLVYGSELGDDIVELLPQHTVPEYLDQGTVNVVEYNEGQVAHDGFSEELPFEIVMGSEEPEEEHSVRNLVTQHTLLLVNVHASLPDPLNIHRVLKLGVTPVELNEEDSSPQSLIIVLPEPLHVGVSGNKEGHVLGTVRSWNSLTITISRVFLVKALLPLIVDLLLSQRLVIKLVY
mgnify:CR=1 FL=1